MSRRKDPVRRTALLDAGQRVLSARGMADTTIDEVTAAAGVAKGTFYLYFHSKDELIAALRQEFAARLTATVRTAMADERPADWPAATRRLVQAAIDGYLVVAPHYEAVLGQPANDPDDGGWAGEIVGMLASFLAQGVKAGAFTVDDPEALATLLFYGVHGMCHHALITGAANRERLIRTVNQLLTGILAP